MISENLQKLRDRIEKSCAKVSRKKESIRVVAVTKNVSVEKIEEGSEAGLNDLGESRVQEAQEKRFQLHQKYPNLRWHLLGALQSNKINRALTIFDCIESVDSIPCASGINLRAARISKVQNCLLEVKVTEELTKTGIYPDAIDSFLEVLQGLKHIRICGLMCLAPYFEDKERTRPYFAKASGLFAKYYVSFYKEAGQEPILSMGMSNDFEIAIEEGSTQVRIGTALFGER